ncbi:Nisin-resistance protein [Streptococcus sp. DD11]|uniref:S41 family peptidase n=1 Tax=Streptococcus sp. DD11 TaxID=1777879 RepID=UPI00079870BD|nr:S41 family peptidase [Streptococcus sp. DD11]KXT84455.1 Nisin-resistance protein [Streptococcus sp. DD11]
MKKVLLGCLGTVLLLAAILVGLIAYFGPEYNVYLFPPNPQTYARSVIRKLDFGLYTSEDWERQKAAALEKLKGAKSYQDTYPILKELTQQAGGKHSYFYSPEENPEIGPESQNQPQTENQAGILYLKLPAFSGDLKAAGVYADKLAGALKKDDYQAVVLDLRDNTGGNMYPMLAGLSSLLPDEELFQFDYGNGSKTPVSRSEILSQSGLDSTEEEPKEVPIAILVNDQTGSSGEMAALAFKGLENVKIFGQPTAGYTSGNQVYSLYDGASLQLTTSRILDRTGKTYENEAILPDVETEQPLEKAQGWLKEQLNTK